MFFLLEHQSTGDPAMPLRVLSYEARIWDRVLKERPGRWLPPVIAALVSHVPGGWTAPRAFEELFDPDAMAIPGLAGLVPRFTMIVEDLTRLSDADLAARPLGAFQKLALWLLRDARDPPRLLDSFDAWIPTMLEVGRARSGPDTFAVLVTYLFQVIDPMYLGELRAKIRVLGPSFEEAAMNIAEHLREEGRKKGREEGRKKGREEGRSATLSSLLVLKFHALGAEYEARLQVAPPRRSIAISSAC